MVHQIYGRHFGRSKNERHALFRNLVGQLIAHGRVKTTVAKAKAIKPLVDKLITKAKKGQGGARRDVLGFLPKEAGTRLLDTIAPQFHSRTSGFSRIVKLDERRSDNAEVVLLEWVEEIATAAPSKPRSKQDRKIATTETQKKVESRKRRTVRKRKLSVSK